MKNKKFLDSMNNISDSVFDKYYKYESRIEQSQAYRKRKFMKACALAACLTICVCIGLALLLPAFIREDHNHTHPETYPNTLEETPSENSQPVETNEENEPPLETSEESEHVHDGNCDCFTGETAVVTQEESTFENERESEEGDSSDLTKFEYSGEMVIEALILSSTETTTESQLILDLLNNGKWIADLCDCINDYTISLNGKAIRYSSFCGTFNNITDRTSLTISDDEKASVNEYLESLFEGIDSSWE